MQPDQDSKPVNKSSYILRLWRTDQPKTAGWQASLEDLHTGKRFGFASLEHLFAYLMEISEMDGCQGRQSQ